jgi:hypothetical protein
MRLAFIGADSVNDSVKIRVELSDRQLIWVMTKNFYEGLLCNRNIGGIMFCVGYGKNRP